MTIFSGLMRSTKAATAIEYGLIVALIFVVALGAMTAVGDSTIIMWTRIGTSVDEVM